jgi:hypothetical protein
VELDIAEVFGKTIKTITWAGDDMCVFKLNGMKLLAYVKDGKLILDAVSDDHLTKFE